MTVTRWAGGLYRGLSTDTKPNHNGLQDYLFVETDTGQLYHHNGSSWVLINPATSSSGGAPLPYSFIIFKDGSTYKALDTITGITDYSSSSAHTVFNSVLTDMNTAGGGMAYVKSGLYIITSTINMLNNTGLIGESRENTILRASGSTNILRYASGGGGAPLSRFTLESVYCQIHNPSDTSHGAWYSDGTEYVVVRNCHFKSFSTPSSGTIMLFLDTAFNVNTNYYALIEGNIFEGPLAGQDMLGVGDLDWSVVSHNLFRDADGQAFGAANVHHTVVTDNVFLNITAATVAFEGLGPNSSHCVTSNNVQVNCGPLKLSPWASSTGHRCEHMICSNNIIAYGTGGIEDGQGSFDIITNNIIYRTHTHGITASLEYSTISNNHFVETNYNGGNRTVGSDVSPSGGRPGGVFLENHAVWTTTKKYNKVFGNTFYNVATAFTIPTGYTDGGLSKTGLTGGVMIDTQYDSTEVHDNIFDLQRETGMKIRDFGTNTKIWNNTNYSIETAGFTRLPSRRRTGVYTAPSNIGASGLLDTLTAAGSESASAVYDTTYGRARRRTSAASAGSAGGWRTSVNVTQRNFNPRMKARFKLGSSSTGQRLLIGFRSDISTDPSDDNDPLNTESGIMLYLRSTDATFQMAYNDGSGATNFTSVSGSPSVNTNIHTIEITSDSVNSRWFYRFDDGANTVLSSDIPAATTAMGIMFMIQSQDGTARSIDQFWLELESD